MKNLGTITDSKSILTKEYGDDNYASKSQMNTLAEEVRVFTLVASESMFKSEANFRAFHFGFDYLCIEDFHDTLDIDTTALDGATVVNNYYDATEYAINKTSSDTLSIQSVKFRLDTTPYEALVYLDYEGSGSISLAFSKNDGETWINIENDTLTDLNALIQRDVRVKIQMTGQVKIKNIAWGCK